MGAELAAWQAWEQHPWPCPLGIGGVISCHPEENIETTNAHD